MNKKPLVIGIIGGSGSGKTTFLHQLKSFFSDEELCILSSDNYYRDIEEQETDAEGIANFDLPGSINHQEFERDVLELLNGKDVEREEYTFNNPHIQAKMLHFKAAPILILEGIFVFHFPEIAKLIDLKVFFYTNESIALTRRIKRDKLERNYPLEDVLYRYEHHVLPTYRKYIEPVKEEADILINNNENFEKGILLMKGFLKNYLIE